MRSFLPIIKAVVVISLPVLAACRDGRIRGAMWFSPGGPAPGSIRCPETSSRYSMWSVQT